MLLGSRHTCARVSMVETFVRFHIDFNEPRTHAERRRRSFIDCPVVPQGERSMHHLTTSKIAGKSWFFPVFLNRGNRTVESVFFPVFSSFWENACQISRVEVLI